MAQKVIWSLKDPEITKLMRLGTEKQLRNATRTCLISSKALITDLSSKTVFRDLIVDKKPKQELPYKFEKLHVVSPKILTRISGMKNAGNGLAVTLSMPEPLSVESFDANGMLIVDGVSDPGELGTILRSASAFSWRTIWITHTCADPFDPLCIRASQGSLFSVPYRIGSFDNAMKHSRKTTGLLKLHFVGNAKASGVPLGITHSTLSETNIKTRNHVGCCFLIQNGLVTEPSSNIRDFKRITLDGVNDITSLPMSVASATLMHIIRNRYVVS